MAASKVVQQEIVQLAAQATKQHATKQSGASSFSEAMRQAQIASQAQHVQVSQHIQHVQAGHTRIGHTHAVPGTAIGRKERPIRGVVTKGRAAGVVEAEHHSLNASPVQGHRASEQVKMMLETGLLRGLKWKERDKDEEEG